MLKNNTSGYVGVAYLKDVNRWLSYINKNNVRICIGTHDLPEEAVTARNNFIIQNGLSEYKIQPPKNSH